MLKKILVDGFKTIRSQELALGRTNILIGQNGAGKSNVLEALGMLSAAAAGTVSYESLASRGVRLSTPGVYRSALRKMPRPKYFNLEAEFENLKYHCNVYTSDSESDTAWSFHSESIKVFREGKWEPMAGRSARGVKLGNSSLGRTIKATESIVPGLEFVGLLTPDEQLSLDSLKTYAIYAPSTNVLRGVDSDPRIKSPLGLTGGGLPSAISDIAKEKNGPDMARFFKVLSWFKSLGVEPPDLTLKFNLLGGGSSVLAFDDQFMVQNFHKLYSFDVSEGALYVAFMLALMLHPKSPTIFALDNVDSTLNPGLVKSVIYEVAELAKKYKKQVILTTHNPTALDAIDLFDENFRLYVADRGENGTTELTRLQPPTGMSRDEWEREFGSAKLSELWIDGLIGGITPPASF